MTLSSQNISTCYTPFSVLIIGAEGVGKSSTINALLNMQVAPVGEGIEAQTTEFSAYQADKLTLWDSPAITPSNHHQLQDFLAKTPIDHILLLGDAGSRDIGGLFSILSTTLLPFYNEKSEDKITLALNHADMAINGKHWDNETDQPLEKLTQHLLAKVDSVGTRIAESTGFKTQPLYFCSGFKDDFDTLKPFHMKLLMDKIKQIIPAAESVSLWQRLLQWVLSMT